MQALPVRLFHASLSGICAGLLLVLLFFHLRGRFVQRLVVDEQITHVDAPLDPAQGPVASSPPSDPDRDRDGIPNEWEQLFHHDPDNVADAAADFDNDGLTTRQEYEVHTRTAGIAGNPLGKWASETLLPPAELGIQYLYPRDINRHGEVLVDATMASGDELRTGSIFVDEERNWRIIGKSSSPSGHTSSSDLNDMGTVAGTWYSDDWTDTGGFLWSATDGGRELFLNGRQAIPSKINNSGDWVGYQIDANQNWRPAYVMDGMNVHLDRDWWPWIWYQDINDYGEALGSYRTADYLSDHAFLAYAYWLHDTGLEGSAPRFDPATSSWSTATAMNERGEFTVGSSGFRNGDWVYAGYVYDGEFREIRSHRLEMYRAFPSSVSDDKTVVGYAAPYSSSSNVYGFIHREGVTLSIDELIPETDCNYGVFISSDRRLLASSVGGHGIIVITPDQDHDGDGMPDDWEAFYYLNCNSAADASADPDDDGTNNLGEFLLRSNPNAAPVLDSDENEIDTRPGIDTDGDGIPNVWEWNNGLNYNDASDAPLDYDRDGYTNLQEFRLNTDPRGAPSYRMRALGPFPGAYSARLSSATLGDGSLPDSSGTYQSGNILESVHFSATPAGYFSSNRPATWSVSRAQDTGDFSMAAGNAPSSPTLLATSTSGATLWRVNGITSQFLFWPSATATHETLSGSVATNNIKLLSNVKISPSGTYVAATRQQASSSNSTDLILWKMPAFTSDIDSRPISLPLPPGATLSGGLQVNDFGQVLGNCRLPSGQMVPVLWKISSTGTGVTLSTLPSFSVGADATATGISNQALPWVCGNATLANGQKRFVVWSAAETLIEIPSLPASGASSATLIARNGTVAGVSEVLVEGAIMHQVFIASHHAASSTWKLQPQGEPLVNPPLLLSVNDHGEILGSTAELEPTARVIPTLWRNGLSHPIADCIANTTSATLESSTQLSPHGTLLATVWQDGEEITVLLVPDRDTDSDGLPDEYENRHAFNAFVKNSPGRDTDSDGLSDLDEYRNGTDPHNPDTDRDGMNDGWEVSWGLLPIDPSDAALDPDGDRVPNFREASIGTVPTGIYKVLPWAPETPVENPEFLAADDAGNLIVADLHLESRTTPDGYTEEEGWKNIWLYPAGGNPRVALPSSTWLQRSSTFDYYYDDFSSGKIPEYALDPDTGMANGWLREYEIHNTEYDFYYSDQTFLIPNAATNVAPSAWLPWQTIEAALRQHPDAALAEGAVLEIWPQAVSSSGTRRIHTSNYPTWKSFVLDQHGNYQYTLPEGLSFSLINDHGEAAVLTSRLIPAVSDQPAFTQWEIQSISHGGTLSDHPLVGFENALGSSLRLLRLSNDRKLLFSFTERTDQLNSVTHHCLLDLATGAVSRLRSPALGAETIISLSTSNSRLLGSGPKPFQITPDGTCIRLDALRIKNTATATPTPFGTIYSKTLTPHHITSDGRITLTTTNTQNQQVILQIVPHNDADGDGLPDDWEKANDLDGPGDKDGDGLTNAEEFAHGTNSFEKDSDGDGISDRDEIRSGLNALNRDQDGNGQTDGYEDWDDDGYINREEVMCRTDPNDPTRYPDGSPEHADPDGPGGLSPIFSIRSYRFELQELDSVRRAVFSKPGYRGFVDGALSHGSPLIPSDPGLELAANNRPNFYLNMETVEEVDDSKEWSLLGESYADKGVRVTTEKTIRVDGVYTSEYAESGSVIHSWTLRNETGWESGSNQWTFPNSLYGNFCELGDSPEKVISDSVKRISHSIVDEYYSWDFVSLIDYPNASGVRRINNTKTITLSEIYSDGHLIADLNDELASTVWENPGQADGVSSSFLWDEPSQHFSAGFSESKYRVVSTEPSIPAGATLKFIWKEVFLPQEGEGGECRAEWFEEGGVKITSGPNAGQFRTSGRHLKHPEMPGTVIPGNNNNGIEAPDEMACLNPGETSRIYREVTNASGNTKVIESVQRGEPIRFQVDLADQKNNPKLTASDVSMVTLWERKKDGEWVNHNLPYNIPAEQAAGVLSDPGSYVLQGKKPGAVTLQITANGVVRDEEEVQFRRMDVDVDSNNSGALETSPEEEKVESDPREPGKILLDNASSESDENGIPLHPEKLAGLKVQTANLKAGVGVTLNYPDKVLRIWKTPPGQLPTQADLLSPNHSYTLSELGLSPGSTAEFSIQSLGTTSGLITIGAACGEAIDEVLINLLPVEIDSRDRAVEGFIPKIDLLKPLKIGFSSGSKSYGIYDIPQSGSSNDVHIYNSVDDIFSDSEAEQYKNGSLSPKAWQQQVVLVRDGNGVRFYTVADNLSEFKVTLYSGNQQVGEVKHQLTEDNDFGRVIAAANGFIKGDEPPRITGWSGFPTDNTQEPPILPALTDDQLGDVLASAPSSVASIYAAASAASSSSNTTSQNMAPNISADWKSDPYQFGSFVLAVKSEATESEWTVFTAALQRVEYDPSALFNNAAPPTGGGAPLEAGAASYSNPPPGQSRNGLTMPSEISNRGLVSKALMWIIKKTVLTQAAVGEGVIFGMWDGIKGDVEGVVDLLTLQPLRDFIQFVKDPYRAAGELYKIFSYLKDNGWDGVKAAATSMLQEFMGQQQARLDCILGAPDVEDPTYLNAYLAGYAVGFIGEQVVVAVFTAGVGKVGWIAKAFEMGSGAATKVLHAARQVGGAVAETMHKASKGGFGDFARVARSADEVRATRRSASLCGSPTGCFVLGTLVLMADGSYRPIENIRHGAVVLADDPYDNESAKPARVRSQIQTHNTTLLDIRYADTATLTCTVEHPFFVVNRGWVMATDLRSGDQFIAPDGRTFKATSVTERSGQFATYNLDVEGPDTFFVTPNSSTPPILTHNLQGEEGMYGYLPASGQVGTSPMVRLDGTPIIDPATGLQRWTKNPMHHFHFDAAVKAMCSDVSDLPMAWSEEWLFENGMPPRTAFPGIELTYEQHIHGHHWGENWLRANGYPNSRRMTAPQWQELYSKGLMNDLAEEIIKGANSRGANITTDKISRLKNASMGRMTDFLRRRSCAGL